MKALDKHTNQINFEHEAKITICEDEKRKNHIHLHRIIKCYKIVLTIMCLMFLAAIAYMIYDVMAKRDHIEEL